MRAARILSLSLGALIVLTGIWATVQLVTEDTGEHERATQPADEAASLPDPSSLPPRWGSPRMRSSSTSVSPDSTERSHPSRGGFAASFSW